MNGHRYLALLALLIGCSAGAQTTPRPLLESQLSMTDDALRLNKQRQEDYRRQSRPTPEYLLAEQRRLEDRRQKLKRSLTR